MEFKIASIGPEWYPPQLAEIPDVPKSLNIVGAPLEKDGLYLAVIGSRSNTPYGKEACERLIAGLAGTDIYIVSGLALGIDTIAHRSALAAGLKTIAFPGSGLGERVLYPATNLPLAKEILAHGGTLVSEYDSRFRATTWSFPRRNRLMAGISHATLVIEAADRSGTLITARLALDYNREVLAVPGNITNENGIGANLLIKQGARPVTQSEDILEAFGLLHKSREKESDLTRDERDLLEFLSEPISREDILGASDLSHTETNSLIAALEIKDLIKEEHGVFRRI